jgi:hypothetical protein
MQAAIFIVCCVHVVGRYRQKILVNVTMVAAFAYHRVDEAGIGVRKS